MLGSGWRSWDRDAQQWVLGATLGMLSPMGSSSHGASLCLCPLEGLGWLSPRTGLSGAVGQGPCPARPCSAPRHSLAMLVLSSAGLPQPAQQHHPAGPKHQTLPGAKSCSIYWPQVELTAAS